MTIISLEKLNTYTHLGAVTVDTMLTDAGIDPNDKASRSAIKAELEKFESIGTFVIGRKGGASRFVFGSREVQAPSGRSHKTLMATNGPRTPVTPPATIPGMSASPRDEVEDSGGSDGDDEGSEPSPHASLAEARPSGIVQQAYPGSFPRTRAPMTDYYDGRNHLEANDGHVIQAVKLRPNFLVKFNLPIDLHMSELDALIVFLQNLRPQYRGIANGSTVLTAMLNDEKGKSLIPAPLPEYVAPEVEEEADEEDEDEEEDEDGDSTDSADSDSAEESDE